MPDSPVPSQLLTQPISALTYRCQPRPGALWSAPRPCSASSSPSPAIRRSVPARSAIAPGIPQRPPIPRSANERWSRSKCRGVQRLPLAAGTQHVAYAIGASPAGHSGLAAAQRMGIHPLGNQRGQHRPQLIGYLKRAGGGVGRCGRASALGSRWLGFWHFDHSPSLASTARSCLSYSGGFALVFRIGTKRPADRRLAGPRFTVPSASVHTAPGTAHQRRRS